MIHLYVTLKQAGLGPCRHMFATFDEPFRQMIAIVKYFRHVAVMTFMAIFKELS